MSKEYNIEIDGEQEEMIEQLNMMGVDIDVTGLVEDQIEQVFREAKAQQVSQMNVEDLLKM